MINPVKVRHIMVQAAILGSCLFILGCENDEKTIREWTEKREMVETAKEITVFFSQSGKLKANLKAPVMLRYQSDTVMVEFPKSLHVDFFDSLGKKESWVDARYGKYFESFNRVLLRDSVRVINTKGDTLATPELWWDQNTQKFYTEKEVRIIQPGKRITGGKGLEAGQDFSWYIIKQPSGTVLVDDDMGTRPPDTTRPQPQILVPARPTPITPAAMDTTKKVDTTKPRITPIKQD
jgi:LPS export ABC transporter protein LptC